MICVVATDIGRPARGNAKKVDKIRQDGIGGLTYAAFLCREGYRVAVLEQHLLPGGYCSSFRRKGFVFNTGVDAVSGLWERGQCTTFWKISNARKRSFSRGIHRDIFSGIDISLRLRTPRVFRLLQAMFPGEACQIAAFFSKLCSVKLKGLMMRYIWRPGFMDPRFLGSSFILGQRFNIPRWWYRGGDHRWEDRQRYYGLKDTPIS